MARRVHLDDNELGFLKAYNAEDPNANNWITPWRPEITTRATGYGADSVAASTNGAMAVARRLCKRKLLEGNSDRGYYRGYCITDKGKKALVGR